MLWISGATMAVAQRLSHDLENASGPRDVIIQFKTPGGGPAFNKAIANGALLRKVLSGINAGAFSKVPPILLKLLALDPNIKFISPDRPVKATMDNVAPTVGADIARSYGYDGTGIGVAVIDSGISAHDDLRNANGVMRVVYTDDFVGAAGTDWYGHGGHVAGIIGGNGKRSTGPSYIRTFRGIAPNVNLVNLRVLDANGNGVDSDVIAAIDEAISLKDKYNIRVMNLSLGRPVMESYADDPLCQAVERAWRAGIVVVVAAGNQGRDNSLGNDGYGTISSPGNDPLVITVGAMKTMGTPSRADDLIASYSSKGPTLIDHIAKPDIVAPGNQVISLLMSTGTLDNLYPGNTIPVSYYKTNATGTSSSYFKLSGTSMAAPVVSGAAALLLQKNPGLTPDQVKARLMRTASKTFPTHSTAIDPVTHAVYNSQYDIFTVGAGYLDIWAALNDTTPVTGSAVSPTAVRNPWNNTVSLVFGTGVVWGVGVVWGDGVVWGSAVTGAGVVWGDGVVWGTGGNISGTGVVWGDGVVWGESSTAGESTGVTIMGEN
jgi:serine protease AprX